MKAAESVEQPTSPSSLYKNDCHVIHSWVYQGSFHFRPNLAFDNGREGKSRVFNKQKKKTKNCFKIRKCICGHQQYQNDNYWKRQQNILFKYPIKFIMFRS